LVQYQQAYIVAAVPVANKHKKGSSLF